MTLKITTLQMEQLANASLTNRIISTLREKFAEDIDAEDPKQLAKAVVGQITLARQYGFESEYGVANFVVTAWMLGLGFDKSMPAVKECLARTDMPEEEKALWLEQFSLMLFTKLTAG